MEVVDRFVGALVGLAVGDALGAPLAFMSREQIQIKHGVVTRMIGGGWLGLRPGEATAETAMALRLGESLLERGGFDRDDVARRYVAWLAGGPRDIDNITRAALALLEQGVPPEEASRRALEDTREDGATNGTLGRGVPLALLRYRDDRSLVRESLAEAALTHGDRGAASGSAILNLYVARLLRGVPGLDVLFDEVGAAVAGDAEGIVPVVGEVRDRAGGEVRPSGRVGDTLELALHALYHGESFEDCLVRTVNRGGYADTAGAVAGALAGAFHGPSSIPEGWLRVLRDRAHAEQTARGLHRLAQGGGEGGGNAP